MLGLYTLYCVICTSKLCSKTLKTYGSELVQDIRDINVVLYVNNSV